MVPVIWSRFSKASSLRRKCHHCTNNQYGADRPSAGKQGSYLLFPRKGNTPWQFPRAHLISCTHYVRAYQQERFAPLVFESKTWGRQAGSGSSRRGLTLMRIVSNIDEAGPFCNRFSIAFPCWWGFCAISTVSQRKRLDFRLIADRCIPTHDGIASHQNKRNRHKHCKSKQISSKNEFGDVQFSR